MSQEITFDVHMECYNIISEATAVDARVRKFGRLNYQFSHAAISFHIKASFAVKLHPAVFKPGNLGSGVRDLTLENDWTTNHNHSVFF